MDKTPAGKIDLREISPLALAFVEALDQPEQNSQLLQELQARVQRVQQRKQEEKAHQKNKRYGKKKQEVSK